MPPNIAMDVSTDMLKRGQALYRGRDYQAALQCFTMVIKNEDASLLIALDNRAITYMHLNDLVSALRDAKRMIQVDKCSSMGYLRTSKILQLSEKAGVALRICEYGLLNVSSEDPNYGLLKSRSKMLIMNSKPADPIAVLPVELVLNIMLYLDFRTVVKLLRISRSWRSMLISFPPLWRKLDFSASVKSIPIATALAYARRAKWTTSHAKFHIKRTSDVEVMGRLMSRCKVLECVEVTANNTTYETLIRMEGYLISSAVHLVNLKTLALSSNCLVLVNTVSLLLDKFRSLERAEFHSVQCEGFIADWTNWIKGDVANIRVLSLKHGGQPRSKTGTLLNLALLLVKMPKLQKLTLVGWSWSSDTVLSHTDFTNLGELQQLSIVRNCGLVFPRLPPSLQILTLWHCTIDRRLSPEGNDNLISNRLPELTDLILTEFTDLTLNGLLSLLSASKGKLKTLDIESCVQLETEDINTLVKIGYLEEVTHLTLCQLSINDSAAELIAQTLPRLKNIDLSLTRVTGIGVKALVLKPHSRLDRLVLAGLSLNRDVIVFATAHGITIDHGNRSKELPRFWPTTKYSL